MLHLSTVCLCRIVRVCCNECGAEEEMDADAVLERLPGFCLGSGGPWSSADFLFYHRYSAFMGAYDQ
jgi:hypothetical protein